MLRVFLYSYTTNVLHEFILFEIVVMFGSCCRTTFLPALKFAREQGLCVTLHCGEVYVGV